MLRNAQCNTMPKNNANPSWRSESNLYCAESCVFVGRVEISLYGKNHFAAMLIGFGDTYLVDTILG